MKRPTIEQFEALLATTRIPRRLAKELRYKDLLSQPEKMWDQCDFVPFTTQYPNNGLLLLGNKVKRLIPYSLIKFKADPVTGRIRPIICDFCKTWQKGQSAATITFKVAADRHTSISFLCCADLACSDHVRGKTKASSLSRTQLVENVSIDDRIARLNAFLEKLVQLLKV